MTCPDTPTQDDAVLCEVRDNVALVELNRPFG